MAHSHFDLNQHFINCLSNAIAKATVVGLISQIGPATLFIKKFYFFHSYAEREASFGLPACKRQQISRGNQSIWKALFIVVVYSTVNNYFCPVIFTFL